MKELDLDNLEQCHEIFEQALDRIMQAMERKYLDKYQIKDKHGYGAETIHGTFRPLDVVDGGLVFGGMDIEGAKSKRARELMREVEERERLIANTFFDTPSRRGRPRKYG